MDKQNVFYTTKDRIECPNCHHTYKSIEGLDIVVQSGGLPVVVCELCRHQIQVLKIEKHTPSVKQGLIERIQAHEKYLRGE